MSSSDETDCSVFDDEDYDPSDYDYSDYESTKDLFSDNENENVSSLKLHPHLSYTL